jgi:hypothetical protein
MICRNSAAIRRWRRPGDGALDFGARIGHRALTAALERAGYAIEQTSH